MKNPETFDLVEFINEGFIKQEKYAKVVGEIGPETLRDLLDGGTRKVDADARVQEAWRKLRFSKVIEHLGHMNEELVEARVYVPRRSWKKSEHSFMDSEQLRKEFVVELYDALLFFRAVLAYAGVTGEEFARLAREKDNYNSVRPDHNTNEGEHVVPHPVEELAGNCDSAKMNV